MCVRTVGGILGEFPWEQVEGEVSMQKVYCGLKIKTKENKESRVGPGRAGFLLVTNRLRPIPCTTLARSVRPISA